MIKLVEVKNNRTVLKKFVVVARTNPPSLLVLVLLGLPGIVCLLVGAVFGV